MISMLEIEDNTNMEFDEPLEHIYWGKLNVVEYVAFPQKVV